MTARELLLPNGLSPRKEETANEAVNGSLRLSSSASSGFEHRTRWIKLMSEPYKFPRTNSEWLLSKIPSTMSRKIAYNRSAGRDPNPSPVDCKISWYLKSSRSLLINERAVSDNRMAGDSSRFDDRIVDESTLRRSNSMFSRRYVQDAPPSFES